MHQRTDQETATIAAFVGRWFAGKPKGVPADAAIADAALAYVDARFSRMKYILGLAIDFTILAQQVAAADSRFQPLGAKDDQDALFRRYPLVEQRGETKSNTLTLKAGGSQFGIRQIEELVANAFHKMERSKFPSAYVYNTGQWTKYQDLLCLSFRLTEGGRLVTALLIVSILLLSGCDEDLLIDGPVDWLGAPVGYDDSGADVRLTVAAVAMASDMDKATNVDRIVTTIDTIVDAEPAVRLLVFPEVAVGKYWLEGDHTGEQTAAYYADELAEPVPGPSTDSIGAKAAERGVWVLVGMAEQDGDRLYDAAVLIGPDGGIVASHHKNALIEGDRAIGFSAGSEVALVDIEGVATAIIVCHDGSSADVAEQIVNGGTKLVIQSVADSKGASFLDLDRGFARAWNTWYVFGNKAGVEGDYFMQEDSLDFAGAVGIISPTGSAEERRDFPDGGYVVRDIGVYTQ